MVFITSDSAVEVTGTLDRDAPVTVNGVEATVTDLTWSANVPLAEGTNQITATATNVMGAPSEATVEVIRDTTAPTISVLSPASGTTVTDPRPTISLSLEDTGSGVNPSTISLSINGGTRSSSCVETAEGADCTLTGALFAEPVELTVTAEDRAGNAGSTSSSFTVVFSLTVTAPASGATVATDSVQVVGEVSDPSARVTINQGTATVEGVTFTAEVPLEEGPNELAVFASNVAGSQASTTLTVERDSQAPLVVITAPSDRSVQSDASVLVEAQLSDLTEATCTINGASAPVVDGAFSTSLGLTQGDNRIEAGV